MCVCVCVCVCVCAGLTCLLISAGSGMLGVQASSVPRASLFLSLLIFCSTQQQGKTHSYCCPVTLAIHNGPLSGDSVTACADAACATTATGDGDG